MIELQGLNKPHKIFADYIEHEALEQFRSAMEQPFAVKGALMPDAHAGYSLPIGAVVATEGVIVPAWVGYDIGCGMCAIATCFDVDEVKANAEKVFNEIYARVPVGFNHMIHDAVWQEQSDATPIAKTIFDKNGLKQLGTLGGGNHFIEIGYDHDDLVWIIIHSGSRNVGHSIATHYMKLASGTNKAKEGHYGFDVESDNGKDYIKDLKFCQQFALENRKQMIFKVEKALQQYVDGFVLDVTLINRNHNHAEEKNGLWIHRKGATHAEEGMMGVIPGNMRDGSFIVQGKGNPDSLYSSSHGAGRVLGRRQAKETLAFDEFEATMKNAGVVARVQTSTLDEAPMAYKNIFEVMDFQKDLVDVVRHVKPILNIKG